MKQSHSLWLDEIGEWISWDHIDRPSEKWRDFSIGPIHHNLAGLKRNGSTLLKQWTDTITKFISENSEVDKDGHGITSRRDAKYTWTTTCFYSGMAFKHEGGGDKLAPFLKKKKGLFLMKITLFMLVGWQMSSSYQTQISVLCHWVSWLNKNREREREGEEINRSMLYYIYLVYSN